MNPTTTGTTQRQSFPVRLHLRVLHVLRGCAVIHMHRASKVVLVAAFAAVSVSCGDAVRQGRSPSMLVINLLTGASGGSGGASTFSGTLYSDVEVLLTTPAPCTPERPCPTIFSDSGEVAFSLAMKDTTIAPTSNNQVTINRYHVEYVRADGRNTPGVDVPFPFDGAVTGTVGGTSTTTLNFEIVRHVAKRESPLVQLIRNPQIISTIARVTFYGRDTVGNEVTVTGSMLIEFGNFGDA
jgi:hypothetical protein